MAMIPELNKKPGVCYAYTDSGLELPVIDITHPAFHQEVSEEQLFAGAKRFAAEQAAKGPFARWLQGKLLPLFLKRSVIGRGLLRSREGYLDGLSTYLMKLGPGNLGSGWANAMDRNLVLGMNRAGMSLAQRLQDMAETLAAGLRPLLKEGTRPLHWINIAGGPSMDSLNALILLYKETPALFAGRPVQVHVLDLESEGAHFAAAALAALQGEGGPLHGLGATLNILAYDWSDPQPLTALLQALPANALVALSSEGGLFDYGDNAAVAANLKALHSASPADCVLAASLSRPVDADSPFQRQGIAKVLQRSLADLEALAPGWSIRGSLSRPINFVVGLRKTA
jgi:hypothetical protein